MSDRCSKAANVYDERVMANERVLHFTYQYRLRPTRAQHRQLERILAMQRLLYNAALEERITAYRRQNISISWRDQSASLTRIRSDDPAGYGSLPVTLSRWTLIKLDQAMKAFFGRVKAKKPRSGFPRFRSHARFRSFGLAEWEGVKLSDDRIALKGLPGALRVHLHRPLPKDASIRSAIFTRDAKGWKIGIQIKSVLEGAHPNTDAIGIDVGLSALGTLSTGETISNARVGQKAAKSVRKSRRALARCKLGSNRRKKVKQALARRLQRVAAARATYHHQVSAALSCRFGCIVVEDLTIPNMTRSGTGSIENPGKNVAQKTGLNRSIQDAAWGQFVQFLTYKAERAGGEVIRVDPRKTSIACSACGTAVLKDLSVRVHKCPDCGFVADRDVNAAINILHRGEAIIAGRAVAGPGVDKLLIGEARPGNLILGGSS